MAEVSETTCLQIQYQKQQISVQNGANKLHNSGPVVIVFWIHSMSSKSF